MIKSYETVDDEIDIPIMNFFDTMAAPLKVTELFFLQNYEGTIGHKIIIAHTKM